MRIILLSLMAFFIAVCAHAGEVSSVDFNGKWRNDMGSELVFVVKDGLVSGRYNTNVGEPENSKSFPLNGQVDGDQIVFTVNFKGFRSMTAWVGQLTLGADNKPYLRTLWHNTKDIEDAKEKDDIWGSIRTGASEFQRVK
ncbi:MAG: avidin [Robiginitomaculum sp.]|nr:MAG: avidin [Robiginitomaculum sp.]